MTNGIVEDGEGTRYLKGRRIARAETVPEAGATADALVTCEDLWSQIQAQCIELLSENGHFLESAVRRAKRTAGNYAQLFLDDEATPNAGRFYWSGLAAFAAKQVVDGIEFADDTLGSYVGQARLMAGVTFYYLLKGNLWVFLEITPWKLYWRKFGSEAFFRCVDRRNVATYDKPAKELTEAMPWAKGENTWLKRDIEKRLRVFDVGNFTWSRLTLSDQAGALAEMNQCRVTGALRRGFREVEAYEQLAESEVAQRNLRALDSAKAFLDHEQKLHLQQMVYEHAEFRFAIDNNDLGRWLWHLLGARDPELVFNAAPAVTPEIERQLKGEGLSKQDVVVRMELDEGKLYDVNQRMVYVKKILRQYHWLMAQGRSGKGEFRPYMIQQLRLIAAWKTV